MLSQSLTVFNGIFRETKITLAFRVFGPQKIRPNLLSRLQIQLFQLCFFSVGFYKEQHHP